MSRTARLALDLDTIIENFAILDEWDDRYRYLIELGRELQPLDADAHNDHNKVRGCASQVWVEATARRDDAGHVRLDLRGDSDAHIVRGLVALVFALYSGQTTAHIIETDAKELFDQLGLSAHLTPQRSNGVRSMVERIKNDARMAASAASG
jgi:cysteine desulfuration protein SufE